MRLLQLMSYLINEPVAMLHNQKCTVSYNTDNRIDFMQ